MRFPRGIPLVFCLITIFTAANISFTYWSNYVQWAFMVIISSAIFGLLEKSIRNQVKIMVIVWFMSLVLTVLELCYPLLVWERNPVVVNEALIITLEKLILIVFMGLIISIVVSMFSSLVTEK